MKNFPTQGYIFSGKIYIFSLQQGRPTICNIRRLKSRSLQKHLHKKKKLHIESFDSV